MDLRNLMPGDEFAGSVVASEQGETHLEIFLAGVSRADQDGDFSIYLPKSTRARLYSGQLVILQVDQMETCSACQDDGRRLQDSHMTLYCTLVGDDQLEEEETDD